MVRDFYVGPVHHAVILGMPWVTQWKARMRPQEGAVEVCVPGDNERVHLSVSSVALTCSMVRGLESAPQRSEGDISPKQQQGAAEGGDDLPIRCEQGTRKGAKLGDFLQLTPEVQQEWEAMQRDYVDILNNNELSAGRPPADRPMHRIHTLADAAPSFAPLYRRTPKDNATIEEKVGEWIRKGIVRRSTSPFAHNVVLAPKKDGSKRLCINFKPLNEITVPQKFPMPRVDELLDSLQGASVFSTLDFKDAYLQIAIHPDDRHKTAFHTRTGKYEFTCMPFGLVNAPAELQRQVNHDFEEPIKEGWLVVYMDDVLIFSRHAQEHLRHLRRALQLVREKQWVLNKEKCSFFMQTITFLGHRVSAAGVQPDPLKIEAIRSWPLPLRSRRDIQSFYGLASYYRRFIPGFASIAAPLTDLLRKDTDFVWGEAQDKAARTLILHLTSSPVLALPDFDKQFFLTADASQTAVGVVLSQKENEGNKHHIIACYSHRFGKTELKYPVREKELYAVWWGVKKCRHYLYGQHFTIHTDHQSLMYLEKSFGADDNDRVTRWLRWLQKYNYTIKYIKGVTNVVADALSRRPEEPSLCSPTVLICENSRFLSKLRSSYSLDTHAAAVIAKLGCGRRVKHYSFDDGLLWFSTRRGLRRLYVPASLRTEVLSKVHDHELAGHGGVNTTVEKVSRSFWWPQMRPAAEEYALSCPDCQQLKPRNSLKPGFLQSLPVPERIWTDLTMDFIVSLPEVRGCDSIYVVVDRLSKYAHFIPCSSSITAEGVAKLFINNVWKHHGFPRSIITDRDPKFVSAFWRSFMKHLNVQHSMTTANHPEADGQTERTNRTLIQYLRFYTQDNSAAWLDFLPCAEWVYNNTVHSSTRCAPASLVYTEAPLCDPELDLAVRSQFPSAAAEEFQKQLDSAKECMKKAQERQERYYNQRRVNMMFEPGDMVLVDSRGLRSAQGNESVKKFSRRWQGPFTVLSRVEDRAYTIDLPAEWRCHTTINIGYLKKFKESVDYPRTMPRRTRSRAATRAPEDTFEVLDSRTVQRRDGTTRKEFLLRWPGERQQQWAAEEELKQLLEPQEFALLLGGTSTG